MNNTQNKQKANIIPLCVGLLVAVIATPAIFAAELGMNYYHESMMGTWGGQYMPRSTDEISTDLDDIKTKTHYVKLYANPMVDGNVDHALRIADQARGKGMYVVLAMNTEDRELNDQNWWDYNNRVKEACKKSNGRVQEFLVGNEIGLHSPWDSNGIRSRAESLMKECEFSGPKSYEAFFWDRDAWKNYDGQIYLNMYEHYDLFAQNINELSEWKHTPQIGEWGDNYGSEDNQAEQIRKRWDKIQKSPVKVAYVFTYTEPSNSGTFGVLRNDHSKKPAWNALAGGSTSSETKKSTTQTQRQSTPESSGWNVGQLRLTVTADGGSWQLEDTAAGTCRKIRYGTHGGEIVVLACKKGNDVELFTQQSPDRSWKLTLANGDVGSHTGYARYTPSTETNYNVPQETVASTPSVSTSSDVVFESDAQGWQLEDNTKGTCRTLRYGTNSGEAKVLVCDKGEATEMYVQQAPNTKWKLTLDGGSVGSHTNFARVSKAQQQKPEQQSQSSSPQSNSQWSATHNAREKFVNQEGTCTKAAFDTDAGYIEALACDKGGHWEMYLKSGANDANISFKGMTVGRSSGFART